MNNSIFNTFARISNIYFKHKVIILLTIIMVIGVCEVICYRYMIKKIKHNKLSLYMYIKEMKSLGVAIIMGGLLQGLNVKIIFKVDYFPLIVFCICMAVIGIYTVIEFNEFRKTRYDVILNSVNWIRNSLLGVCFMLSIMNRLDWIEFICSIVVFILLYVAKLQLKCCKKHANTQGTIATTGTNNREAREDREVTSKQELFPTRQKQLDSFCEEIDNMDFQPFAIMVTGRWGVGKSSFINAFQDETKNKYEFIYIPSGFECNISMMLDDIANQLEKIFIRNGIYTLRNRVIKEYFNNVGELVGELGYKFAENIIKKYSKQENLSYVQHKQELNNYLDMFNRLCNKRIIFIVDDLDRCNEEVKEKMFEVIRECIRLNNCCTLFLADDLEIRTPLLSESYIEKYIYRKIQLIDVTFNEMLEYYKEYFLDDEFFKDKCEDIKKQGQELREILNQKVETILNDLNEHINGTQKNQKDEIELIKKTIDTLNKTMTNPRKVKRFFHNLENTIHLIDSRWFSKEESNINRYSKNNWMNYIFQIEFIRNFLDEEYSKIKSKNSIQEYISEEPSALVTKIIISDLNGYGNEEKQEIINLIIYHLYDMDSKVDKCKQQELEDELKNNSLRKENILLYIPEVIKWNTQEEYIKNIYEYIEDNGQMNEDIIKEVLKQFLAVMCQFEIIGKKELTPIIKEVKEHVWDKYCGTLFTNNERSNIRKMIEEKYIIKNQLVVIQVLNLLVENKDDLEDNIRKTVDLNDLYQVLRDLKLLYNYELHNTESQIKDIKDYFIRVKKEYNSEEYKEIKPIMEYLLDQIANMIEVFEICFKHNEVNKSVKKYISFNSGMVLPDSYKDINNLLEALDCLKEKAIDKDSNDNKFIAAILTDFVIKIERYMEQDIEWFNKKEKEVISKLGEIYLLIENILKSKEVGVWANCGLKLFTMNKRYIDKTEDKVDKKVVEKK